ncbi:MAG: PilZ domain-containing protein [Myxococcales bacterium]|nr:PilZ domain-containing protein [Myxococcales bacterium]MCB9731415.1 PilZ domain-containing protein [Deltaproteobacteria bacterium]
MAEKDTFLVEEQQLFEQEQGLVEMEAQLYEQEQGVAQMERAFRKRNRTLLNLVAFVGEQEQNLVARAESIGPAAKTLVDDRLSGSESASKSATIAIGCPEQRKEILERRQAVLAERMKLAEAREALYAARYEAMEKAEGATADIEKKLLQRERDISTALRELVTSSSSLLGEDEEDDDDHEEAEPRATGPPPSSAHAQPGRVSHGADIRGEPVTVVGGETETDGPGEAFGANSRTEDEVTRRRKGRARARTNQFRITLEAQMDSGEAHEFFTYRNDGPDDLPGIFIATPNLLKVGREVRVRVGLKGSQLEATGVVAWRRQRGESGGPPGMGIELLHLSEPDRAIIATWVESNPPVTI